MSFAERLFDAEKDQLWPVPVRVFIRIRLWKVFLLYATMRTLRLVSPVFRRWRFAAWFLLLVAAALYGDRAFGQAQEEEPVYTEIPPIVNQQTQTSADQSLDDSANGWGRRQYLGTFLNDGGSEIIAEFTRTEDGRFLITAQELQDIGLVPDAAARNSGGLIDIALLPHVSFDYNEEEQTIRFSTFDDSALLPTEINLSAGRRFLPGYVLQANKDGETEPAARANFGGLVNYALYADSGSKYFSDLWRFSGASSQLEGRLFGKAGTLSSNHVVRFASGDYQNSVRLDSNWSYWDAQRLTSYTAGDFITRGLVWTRPVRMGGFQWRRNFAIRSDLVTMPLPSLSGSAAVPSSVDIYINNLQRNSAELPAGPYRITDLPVVTGSNEARVVVKDALGRETVTELPFYASIDMLAKGLTDFSLEGGFLRYNFGSRSNDYSHDFAASGTWRYGLSNHLTLETHGEYASRFYNGGMGAVFSLGSLGVGSISGAGSHYRSEEGWQAAAGLETERWGMRLNIRSQRAFGKYNDLASATQRRFSYPELDAGQFDDIYYDTYYVGSNRPIKALDQVSLGVPLKFDPTTLNISYTHGKYYDTRETQFLSLSASRSFGRRVFGYANAYKDLQYKHTYSIFAGLSISFDRNIQLASGVTHDQKGTSYQTELSKYETQAIGSTGWRLRDVEGAWTERSAYGSYRARVGRFAASVAQGHDHSRATAEVEGALVAAGGSVFATNRIDDSFAVVDTGAPGIPVLRENTLYGTTGRSGKLIVPDLLSYRPTKLSIDAGKMPLNAIAVETSKEVMPAYRTGVVARFSVEDTGRNALITVVDEEGSPLELGSLVESSTGVQKAAIGYDGETFLPLDGEQLPAEFLVKRSYGGLCRMIIPRTISLGGLDGATQIQCRSL